MICCDAHLLKRSPAVSLSKVVWSGITSSSQAVSTVAPPYESLGERAREAVDGADRSGGSYCSTPLTPQEKLTCAQELEREMVA